MWRWLKDISRVPRGFNRSPSWPQVRSKWLIDHDWCEACGGKKKLEVHHRIPFHIDPNLELDWDNLITLCESKKYGINCHLFVGHIGNYSNYNRMVMDDARFVRRKLRGLE